MASLETFLPDTSMIKSWKQGIKPSLIRIALNAGYDFHVMERIAQDYEPLKKSLAEAGVPITKMKNRLFWNGILIVGDLCGSSPFSMKYRITAAHSCGRVSRGWRQGYEDYYRISESISLYAAKWGDTVEKAKEEIIYGGLKDVMASVADFMGARIEAIKPFLCAR